MENMIKPIILALLITLTHAGTCYNPLSTNTTNSGPNSNIVSYCPAYVEDTCCTTENEYINFETIETQINNLRSYLREDAYAICLEYLEPVLCSPCVPRPMQALMMCQDYCQTVKQYCPENVFCLLARSVTSNPTIACDAIDYGQSTFDVCNNYPTTHCFSAGISNLGYLSMGLIASLLLVL
eukprot:TRINITY_DN1724_c0_g1_i2.p1 TRINITY_DN1724_c0_g1~~TRINITY_DN1724_c0_g1_i2.p1  ORF type:complete len:182 (-),score=15.47 TRINITY_DN1724_c0_g1_i2:373-918(-)